MEFLLTSQSSLEIFPQLPGWLLNVHFNVRSHNLGQLPCGGRQGSRKSIDQVEILSDKLSSVGQVRPGKCVICPIVQLLSNYSSKCLNSAVSNSPIVKYCTKLCQTVLNKM